MNFQSIISRNLNPLDPAVLTIGKVEAGTARNVIAGEAKIEGTARTFSRQAQEMIESRVKEIAKAHEQMYGVDVSVDFQQSSHGALINDPGVVEDVMEKAGEVFDPSEFTHVEAMMLGEDFANYLELYYKYQDQYQVEEILSGTIREEVCDKLQKAPFDERMAVTGLLLAKLTDGFKELKRMNETMTLLMAQLKQFKKELDGADVHALAPAMILESIGAELESIRIHKKESGLSDRRQDHIYRKVKELLEQYVQQMKARSLQEKEDSWNWLRQQFMEKSDAYEDKKTVCGERLEHAFDFMEAAFANGQELVIFVTGLNTGEASVEFLKEYNCERYYRYNKELLFDNQENEMKEVLGK